MAVTSIFFAKAAVLAIVTTALWRLARKILRKLLLASRYCLPCQLRVRSAIPDRDCQWRWPRISLARRWRRQMFRTRTATAGPSTAGLLQAVRLNRNGHFFGCCLRCLWLAPVALLYGWLGAGHVYVQEAMFFSQVAVVTLVGPTPSCPIWRNRQ